ncbi:hypothetical protein JVT61DRAFT_8998 [Boletus reticuloceps]|uniref:BTB domain-containing protein n=1 Tax=Boletus reticuloceps TaxID=495285 RepID=A0A8I2YHB6_9AGAM|nr:hypothetical protein JVT61DRAFT_8998 [Boletus reticuloceps]
MTSGPASSTSSHYRSIVTLISLSVVAVGVSWRLWRGSRSRDTIMIQANSQVHRHPVYWFDDGTVIVRACNNQVDGKDSIVLFRIHEPLLRQHTKVVLEPESEDGYDVPIVTVPGTLGVQVQDFTSLLAHLYNNTPLSLEAPFQHVAAILRVSSPEQLDLPSVHSLARSYLVAMFPSGPSPFVHPSHLEEALSVALRYNITSIQKGIYYSIVTTTDFEPSSTDYPTHDGNAVSLSSKTITLTPTDVVRCRNLINGIVEHFTPVLFEPPVTPHMACTNLLADKWFPMVIQSAIAGDSVCKPLEALEQLKQIDWEAEDLCAACVREKREEWTNEQGEVWEKMDDWLKLDTASEQIGTHCNDSCVSKYLGGQLPAIV